MFIKSFKINKKIFTFVLLIIFILVSISIFYSLADNENQKEKKDDYIKWVDFDVTAKAMKETAKLDIDSHKNNNEIKFNWIELLAYLSCKYGGNFEKYNSSDLDKLVQSLNSGESISDLSNNMKFYNYYYESLSAVLSGFIGNYSIQRIDESGNSSFENNYGLKAFLPIAKNYSFNHYKDFGASRSYGFKRTHLGNDLMGQIGTPIIAVESGVIENLGWNQYGGWRIGIRSFDSKRYYYYAHLRKNHPYVEGLEVGSTVNAGDVIRISWNDWI